MIANIERLGCVVGRNRDTDLLTVNGEFSASLVRPDIADGLSGSMPVSGPISRLRYAWRPGNREILDY